jgi:hypothetical protein
MSLLDLDYCAASRYPVRGVALLVLAVAMLAATGWYYSDLSGETEKWERAEEAVNGGVRRKERAVEGGLFELVREIGNANEVLRSLVVPWDEMFHAIEASGDRQVTLLGLEPNIERQQVRINGEARNFKAVMAYLTELEQQPVFGNVFLLNHEVRQESPDKPVRFTLQATWKEAP